MRLRQCDRCKKQFNVDSPNPEMPYSLKIIVSFFQGEENLFEKDLCKSCRDGLHTLTVKYFEENEA